VSDIVDAHVAYCKTISDLNMDKAELRERIKRLETAGNELRECAAYIGTVASGEASVIRRTQEAIEEWNNKTK
jgi:hypothetical protein